MPIVRIDLFKGRTREQKAKVAKEITDLIQRDLGVPPDQTLVIFNDIEKSDWAVAGKLSDGG
ncbi:MAG TPA: 2-hydroxymuconate tautomerase [Xanthobacteraceae bacterium]|nr:2-hydroxymuconate tautomerase [Xanthobacteraceae bacterium]